ncbi:MAG: hypothetical protein KKG25_08305 [Bacteroidetes bacterium]|nr:hypothetical protein [Bacteroidota bacterium]MBU1484839.1 hypothetical protein [Bacteroidota bacterium]MBU2269519.1 hypothetical protein [Bacteroidota bacterium]MBU2376192.1 hypothetical protein [Bacteroidota bacterium]
MENRNPHYPTMKEVIIYFNQKGFENEDTELFFKEFNKKNWQNSKGRPLNNWRAKANDRMWKKQKNNPYLRSKGTLMFN